MASLKELRNRIASVQATQKMTRAMQMVAASKLRRAQEHAQAARPYVARLEAVMANLAADAGDAAPPLLAGTGHDKTHLLLVATAERGLCGGFNAAIARLARTKAHALAAEGKTVKILCVGRKGYEALKRDFDKELLDPISYRDLKSVGFTEASEITARILSDFEDGAFDVCTLFYAQFESVLSQIPVAQQLIPFNPTHADGMESAVRNDTQETASGEAEEGARAAKSSTSANKESEVASNTSPHSTHPATDSPAHKGVPIYEPDAEDVLAAMLPRRLAAQILAGLLENAASEQGARMSAMDSATRNADDIIDNLTITYNRTRQAQITKELIEIISGAEAL